MIQLNSTYNRDDFLRFLETNFLTDFKKDVRPVNTQGISSIQKANLLGSSKSLDLQVFEFSFKGSPNKRVTLTKDAFQVMRSSTIFRALAIFHSPDSDDWRLSLMTATPERTEAGKVMLSYSNPKRLSFFLGPNAKIKTPTNFIIKKDRVIDFEDLKSRFSIEVVNKEFYKEISELFTQLVGGSVDKGKKRVDYDALLKLPSLQDKSQTSLEFAVRLIGRVIFCWFLREKKSDQGKSLMPNDLLSLAAIKNNTDYYHQILEPIFFEVLNVPIKSRKDDFAKEPFASIPYLNGGLFSPHDDDFFSYNEGKQAVNHNTVIVPDEWLLKLFEVLETYNFTIDENTGFDEELSIDPEMLGRIFENLLAEINPETGESARKSTGSYYTPRVIVDYMVDESLLLYLKNQTQISEKKLRAVISYDLYDDEENLLTGSEREQIINALEKVKILDPACGSGAFPIGALQKIVFILQQADPEGQLWFKKQIKNASPELRRVVEREFAHKNFDYIRKLGIIRENIYGVDIQPIATEISRLRCFLTLVVDERIQEGLENRGIEPLPNLDFKFVTANTLISLPESQVISQKGLFEDAVGIEELKELRDLFFNASGGERDQLKLQFVQAQNRMFQRLITEGIRGHAELTTKLTTWDPFSHKSASWFDPEWMFGLKEGFDIVIANPPYISVEKFSRTAIQASWREMYITYSSRGDIYCFFYEQGISLLKQQGVLCYISSNKFMRSGYGKGLRELLAQNMIKTVIDFCELHVFTASTDPAIVILTKEKIDNANQVFVAVIKEDLELTDLNIALKERGILLHQINLKHEGWNIESQEGFSIVEKLRGKGIPLKKYVHNRIYYGIKTGLNEAFVIDEQTRDILIKEDPNSAKLIRKWIRGRDIKRWYAEWNQWYVIVFPYGYHSQLEQYPAILRHLSKFEKELKKRGQCRSSRNGSNVGQHHWLELDNNPKKEYLNCFEETKIVFNETSKELHAYIDTEGYAINKTGFIILTEDPYYLLAVLNSKLMDYLYRSEFPSWGDPWKGGRIQFRGDRMATLPIPLASDSQKSLIIELVQKIISKPDGRDFTDLEAEIDQRIYELYGLTEVEIALVEGSISMKI